MAQEHPITRLGGWAGYEVVEDWQERRGAKSWRVLRLEAVTGWLRQCSQCGESTRAVHDQQERRIRDLPIFESTGWSWSCRGCGWPARAVGPGWSG